MKTFKDILVCVLLVLTVSFYLGHDIANGYKHVKSKTENTSNTKNSHSIVSSETSLEEEVPVTFFKDSVQFVNSGCESFSSLPCHFPPQLYYSIWLPPDIA